MKYQNLQFHARNPIAYPFLTEVVDYMLKGAGTEKPGLKLGTHGEAIECRTHLGSAIAHRKFSIRIYN